MKKLAVLAATATLSIAVLTGCGAPKIETLVDGMYETEVESCKMELKFDFDASAEVEDEEFAAKASGEFTIDAMNANKVEDVAMAINGSVNYNIMDGMLKDKMKIEAYIETEDDEQTVYYKDPDSGDYYYMVNSIEDAGFDISEKNVKKIQDAAKELWYSAEVSKKTEDVNGEKCYVLTMTPSGEDYIKLMDSVTKIMDVDDDWDEVKEMVEDELDITIEDILDKTNISFKAYVSAKNKYMVGCEVDMSGIDIDGLLDLFEDMIDDADIEIGDISLDACSFSIMMSDINATEVEVPKKVKKEAVEFDPYAGLYGYEPVIAEPPVTTDPGTTTTTTTTTTTSNKKIYNEATGEFTMYDYWNDEVIMEFKVPEGYSMDYYDETDGSYFYLEDDDWNTIGIDTWSDYYAPIAYIVNNEMPDKDYYTDFECEYVEDTYGDYSGYTVAWSYKSGTYTYNKYEVIIPYKEKYFNETEYIVISFDESLTENWATNGYKVIEELLKAN